MKPITVSEVAQRIGTHPNTVRNWTGEYAEFLSPGAASGRRGKRRLFTEKDVLIMATVADLRGKDLSREQVIQALQAGARIEVASAVEAPRADLGIVPAAQYQQALAEVQRVRDELIAVTAERDRALERGDRVSSELNTRIAELENQLGRAQGQLAERFSTRLVIGLVLFAALLVAIVALLLLRG